MKNIDLDTIKELKLTGIKKYQRRAGQVKIKLDWLYDWIPTLTIFMRYSCKMYDNKKMTQNMNAKGDIDPEQVLSFFVQLYRSIQYQKMNDKDILDITKLVKKYI